MRQIEFRKLLRPEELKLVQEVENKVWGALPLPLHQTITAVKNGGLIIGAFDGEKLIGYSYAFPGMKDGKTYLCSHMLGICPAYQSQGLGEELKWEQRKHALEMGYDLIKWTYDPLETKNARLNLGKLKGVSFTYIENCYGNMQDNLNQGLPSDRLEVAWFLKSAYLKEGSELNPSAAKALNIISFNEEALPVFKEEKYQDLTASLYSLKVPKDFQSLKLHSPKLALDWRMKSRKIFQELFSVGLVAFDLKIGQDFNTYYFARPEKHNLPSRSGFNDKN